MRLHSQTNRYTACDQVVEVCLGLASCPCVLPAASLTAAVPELLWSRSAPLTGCLWGWRLQPSSGLQLARGVCGSHLSHGAASTARRAAERQHPAQLPLLWITVCQQSCALQARLRSLRGNTAGTSNAPELALCTRRMSVCSRVFSW